MTRLIAVLTLFGAAMLTGCSGHVGDTAKQLEDLGSRLAAVEASLADTKAAFSKAVSDQATASAALQDVIDQLRAELTAAEGAWPDPATMSESRLAGVPVSSSSSDAAIMDVLRRNIRASNDEDVAAYMATMHPSSPGYEATEAALLEIVRVYDLSYTLERADVVAVSEDEAAISFVLVTRRVSGPAFMDNRIAGTMNLRKYRGEWKIYDQTLDHVESLP